VTWTVGAAVLAVTVGTVTPAAAAPREPEPFEITMLATTDLHGRVNDWDYFKNAPYTESKGHATGLARVGSAVDSVRAERGEGGRQGEARHRARR